jgi:hypothetical protein
MKLVYLHVLVMLDSVSSFFDLRLPYYTYTPVVDKLGGKSSFLVPQLDSFEPKVNSSVAPSKKKE